MSPCHREVLRNRSSPISAPAPSSKVCSDNFPPSSPDDYRAFLAAHPHPFLECPAQNSREAVGHGPRSPVLGVPTPGSPAGCSRPGSGPREKTCSRHRARPRGASEQGSDAPECARLGGLRGPKQQQASSGPDTGRPVMPRRTPPTPSRGRAQAAPLLPSGQSGCAPGLPLCASSLPRDAVSLSGSTHTSSIWEPPTNP